MYFESMKQTNKLGYLYMSRISLAFPTAQLEPSTEEEGGLTYRDLLGHDEDRQSELLYFL